MVMDVFQTFSLIAFELTDLVTTGLLLVERSIANVLGFKFGEATV